MATHSLGQGLYETLTKLKAKTHATTPTTRTKALPFCPRKESRPKADYPGKQSSPWYRTYLAELPLVQPNFEEGQAIFHAWEVRGCIRQEMQVGDHHCVTEDGVVVVRGWGLSSSCVGRLTACWTQPPTACPQKRAAVNPPRGTGGSLCLKQTAS